VNQTETATIRLDQYIAHPPSKVWRALTEPAYIGRWWGAGNIAPTVGHRFELDMGDWGMQPCTVLEVQPEALISYTFGENWTITWRLEPEGEGTRIFLEHAGLDLSKPNDAFAFKTMEPGWREHVLPALARASGEI
jgi:uncharacterized protein YndB with AHSA1/START domain